MNRFRNAEVEGSIPFCSTNPAVALTTIGAFYDAALNVGRWPEALSSSNSKTCSR